MRPATLLAACAALAILAPAAAAAATCDSLTTLALPNATITAALVPAGGFVPPGGAPATLPAFCRVTASLRPTADSDIRIEVWLPAAGWNGKLQSVGNGGWAGTVPYSALGTALASGYAAAGTDTGHVGNTAKFATGHPEKLVDYGYRAVHEMTVAAKASIAAFYGNGPRLSYWNGCSTGGRQGLMEALRYPADYDGIVAGAPVNFRTHQLTWELWVAQAVHRDEASYIPPAKYPADPPGRARRLRCPRRAEGRTHRLAAHLPLRSSGAGVPERRRRRLSHGAAGGSRAAHLQPRDQPEDQGRRSFRRCSRAASSGGAAWPARSRWAKRWSSSSTSSSTIRPGTSRRSRGTRQPMLADTAAAQVLNVTDPNLKLFFDRGGKLLLYHGWNDQLVAPLNSVNYYQQIVATAGRPAADDSVRLFMMPGMNHCGGGEGPNTFDRMSVIERWVEQRQPPARIEASHATGGTVDRTRPLCPYPQVARYSGAGSIDDAANFTCRQP